MTGKIVPAGGGLPAKVDLPKVDGFTAPMLSALTVALGVDRAILASDDQIGHAWSNLSRLLNKIPPESRTENMARMCVSVAVGLFDSSINYVWNSAITELRNKVRRFGLNVVPQITGSDFDEAKLIEQKDADLLTLSLRLNLISEEGYFMLDQCRDIRNNFSAAHPSMGALNEDEFLNFLNRCARYALGDEHNPRGVDIQAFVAATKGGRFQDAQLETWSERLRGTHDAQRELLFGMLHGIYCDPASGEEARQNALSVCAEFKDEFTPRTRSELIDRHQDYIVKGGEKRHVASQKLFENLGLIGLLSESERHALISSTCGNLLSVHNAFDNFHNEPPFAQRLEELGGQTAIPETAQAEYVEAVVTCATGNPYGVSSAAVPSYHRMIQSFSPREIRLMLDLPGSKTVVANRIKSYQRCSRRYKELVALLRVESVPTLAQAAYKKWSE